MTARVRRRWTLVAALLVPALALGGCGVTPAAGPTTAPSGSPTDVCGPPTAAADGAPLAERGPWASGASGAGVADGGFGRWRGDPAAIAGTWNDSYDAQTRQCTVLPDREYGAWQRDLDVAVGAIYADRGETWAQAAAGAYDDRWRRALTVLRDAWRGRPGTLYVRFAHEFNGDWVPWPVRGDEVGDFVTAWGRFRALQRELLPDARLVFCPNDQSAASLGLDWRDAFPGAERVDVMGVDSYNQRDFATTPEEFAAKSTEVDDSGAPVGIEAHRRFAESVGLPLALPEWGSNADIGDAPVFVELLHGWLTQHAGSGPGQVPYEILFNVDGFDDGAFAYYPTTRQPATAEAYARLF